jgi:hypothetical protein
VAKDRIAPFADAEKAAEAGRASAAAAKRRREAAKEAPEVQIAAELPALVASMLDAALGRGSFASLKPQDRLKALQTALAYGMGRPGTAKPAEEAPEPPSAAALFGAAPE